MLTSLPITIFAEETQTYVESCYGYASTDLAAELHRQHGIEFDSMTVPSIRGLWRFLRKWRSRNAPRSESRQAQTLERGVSRSSTDVRHNDQFKNCDIGEFNSIFFDLAYYVRWVEIPLLPHDFSK